MSGANWNSESSKEKQQVLNKYCFVCLCTDEEKNLKNYFFQCSSLKEVLQVMDETLKSVRTQMHPLVNLSSVSLNVIDVMENDGSGLEESFSVVCSRSNSAVQIKLEMKEEEFMEQLEGDLVSGCDDSDKIQKFFITREQCLEEKAKMLQDSKYIEAAFKCADCAKHFTCKQLYDKHMERHDQMLIHEGYKRPLAFPCSMCDKVFDRKQVLKAHLRTHTGERPYQCSKCPAQFSQSSILRTHVRLIHLKLTRDGRPKVK
ncbi:hypothetical protein HF086_016505 [Spodoptera exigua]|uniref:C2H2-type domain-containing protein n=2 Tax=Spodoptera exigua TaxID=7107 RepID=A0A922SN91_SPOEX|nr:hypothetical protein HF086_016505 [Spodoptera exigua]